MSTCHFCESYKSHVNVNQFKQDHPEWYDGKLEYEITVAMVIRKWRPGKKRNCGSTTDYRYRGCGYALNYCPECGKKLEVKHEPG